MYDYDKEYVQDLVCVKIEKITTLLPYVNQLRTNVFCIKMYSPKTGHHATGTSSLVQLHLTNLFPVFTAR
jgi:hypothetical protein